MAVWRVLIRIPTAKSTGGSHVRVFVRGFRPLAWYNTQLQRAPVLTKSITSGVLFGLGDVIAQTLTRKPEERFDWPRLGRAWVFGTFILGPLAHLHFNFLEWVVVKRLALTGASMPFVKMFIDQFTYWAPGINAIYLFSLPALEGRGAQEAFGNVKEKLWPILKANWMLWPAAQLVNFRLVPVAHQLNFVLAVSLLWATYLSWATGEKKH